MYRYLLFSGDDYYPMGGWDDFKDSSDDIEALEERAKKKKSSWSWWTIVDLDLGEVVKRGSVHAA